MTRKQLILSVAGAAALIAAVSLWISHSRFDPAAIEPAAGDAAPGMPVEAQPVTIATAEDIVEAVGTLQSNESVTVRPEIAGLVTDILFEEGGTVEKGDVLVRLDDSIPRAELAEAQAQLILTKANFERAESLYEKQTGTRRTLDEARAALKAAEAHVALAEARLAKTAINAPFAGSIGLRSISVGDYVVPGQDIVNLEDISTLKADFRVGETWLPMLRTGQEITVQLDSFPDRTFAGEVYAIDPRVDDAGRSILIRARVPNDEGSLVPGLFARVRLVVSSRENAILIPEQAIIPQKGQQFVYRVIDGKADMTPVEIGLRRKGTVEIKSGLSASDTVITAGQMKVQPGAPVTVLPSEPPPSRQKAE